MWRGNAEGHESLSELRSSPGSLRKDEGQRYVPSLSPPHFLGQVDSTSFAAALCLNSNSIGLRWLMVECRRLML